MDFLILSPPVTTPAEPPSGAFLLAAGLAGHGYDAALLDLSLEFLSEVLHDERLPAQGVGGALDYLYRPGGGYDARRHRGAAGALHRRLKGFSALHAGWRLSLMDLLHAERPFPDPPWLAARVAAGGGPFGDLWERVLDPVLDKHRPRRVLLSVAYLSQLAGALSLHAHLRRRGVQVVVGGSLPRSLQHSGEGVGGLAELLPPLELSDGLSLISTTSGHLLERLDFPALLSRRPYLSSRPILPLTLSTGCYWDRCLFCPDRGLAFHQVPMEAMDTLLSHAPLERPVIHLLDSALPPAQLRRFLPLSQQHKLGFYGFARPTKHLRARGLLRDAAEAGCLMLQLGTEGASEHLLDRFDKGLDPAEAEAVVREAAGEGVRTYLYLLFGLPGETAADREATHRQIADNADAVDFLNLSLFNLPHHSELFDRAAEFGIEAEDFPAGDALRLYRPFRVDGASPRRAARDFLGQVFKVDPRIRPIVLRTPRWLRAAHLALMEVEGRRPAMS